MNVFYTPYQFEKGFGEGWSLIYKTLELDTYTMGFLLGIGLFLFLLFSAFVVLLGLYFAVKDEIKAEKIELPPNPFKSWWRNR